MNKKFIFDLDDTLMYNLHDYSFPELDFVKLVINRIGPRAPNPPAILKMEEEIDKNNVEKLGFTKERFPTSMAQTYRKIAKGLGINDFKGEQMAYEIGTQAFSIKRWERQGLVEGAIGTINYLKKKNDKLILMTKGDPEIQQMKIKANNLESIFGKENIHIVTTKNKESFNDIIKEQNLDKVWHIGNSIKSDVIPAIKAKIGIIYIPLETWAYEKQHNGMPKYNKLFKINDISEIKKIYHKL